MSNKPSRQASHAAKVRAASNSGKGSTTWLWVGLVAVVVVVGVVAIAVGRSATSDDNGGSASPSGGTVVPNGDLDVGTVQVTGTPLPQPSETGADPGVGQTIPTVTGESFDGSAVIIEPGKPTVIMAVAHWCPHCQAEVPRIQEWLDENGMPADVELVTVATSNSSSQPNYPAGPWLRGEGWSVATMLDDQNNTVGQALGIAGFPTFIVVDADGRVVERLSGEISTEVWEALLADAVSGQATVAGASSSEASPSN